MLLCEVVLPLFPILLPSVALLLILEVGAGVGVAELGELVTGGGGKPGVTVSPSKSRAFALFCELLKLIVIVLLP